MIEWIRASFEGSDGKSSYRRLTTFGIFCLIAYMVITRQVKDHYTLWAFITLCAVLLLSMGLVTFDQLTRFKNGDRVEYPTDPIPLS